MKVSKISSIFKRALFPAIMTIISFILFIGVYLLMTVRAIEPYYFVGLIFTIPFISFGIITFFTMKGKLRFAVSSIITIILVFVLGAGSLFALVFISLDAATTTTRDIGKYERVLKLRGYPSNTLIEYFPDKIPNDAKEIVFNYHPAVLQGSEIFVLKFQTDLNSINNYIKELSKEAKWAGKLWDDEAKENGIFSNIFSILGYSNLPEDFTIYLLNSEPYRPKDWNHGELSLVAISEDRNEVIFLAEDW